MHNLEQLKVWQLAMDIAKEIYVLTNEFPSEEKFGLTSQIRRAAVSIASNIAEERADTRTKSSLIFCLLLRALRLKSEPNC